MSPEEKIEAAQKLIDEARAELTAMREKAAAPHNWPERIDAGMVFRHRGGAVYVWAHDRCQELVCLVAGGESRCGDVFDKDLARACMDSFSYLGHARDLIKIADDAHEPTGAELVGKRCEYCDIDGDWDHWDTGVCKSFAPGADRPYLHQGGQFRFARLAR